MEQMEAMLGFEWDSMSGICSDEADFMVQLLGNCSIPDKVPGNSIFPKDWPYHASNDSIDCERSMYQSPDETNASMLSFSQGGSVHVPYSSSHEGYYDDVACQDFVNIDEFMCMDFCMENIDFVNQDVSNDSIESNEKKLEVVCGNNLQLRGDLVIPNMADAIGGPPGSKKRSRPSGELQRDKRSKKLKKSVNIEDDDFDHNNDTNVKIHQPSSSSCCSENDSNASHKLDEVGPVSCSVGSEGSGPLNLNGKRRASRASATDPQSVYARKRRERINERLRILQSLVPNGTKVDISTMLEEAVEYVKFLQLQIKLLSSDDLWMYAPIAYNGMDIGLDLKISSLKPQSS